MKTIAFSSVLTLAMTGLAGVADAADDWLRRDGGNGLVYYFCTSDRCGGDSVVSCRVRDGDPIRTLERYEVSRATQRRAFEDNGRTIELGAPMRTVHGAWVLYQHPYVVGTPGKRVKSHFRGGYLAGPSLSFSIVSSSEHAARTKRNFDREVDRLMRSPKADARERCTPREESPSRSGGHRTG
jgi:hypothetical protein